MASVDKETSWSDIDEGAPHHMIPTSAELHRTLRSIDSDDDSQEPYYDVYTGKIVLAREAWTILANEGHPRFRTLLADGGVDSAPPPQITDASSALVVDHQMMTNNDIETRGVNDNDDDDDASVPPPEITDSSALHHQITNNINLEENFSSGPTQHSIDMALDPSVDSHDHISPKHIKDIAKKKRRDDVEDNIDNYNGDVDETDPIILRATAMALAASQQGGQKKLLTPQQLQLIATPDVQQQKLIMEAKRAQKAKEIQSAQQKWVEVQQIGVEFGKFIQTETREKPVLEWGKDIGKFIESKMTTEGGEGGGGDDSSASSSPQKKTIKKKMEGFGSEPPPTIDTTPLGTTQSTTTTTASSSLSKGNILSNMKLPTLPNLNESIANIIFPVNSTNTTATINDTATTTTSTTITSAILWKRRSGIGKLISTTSKAWEKRRVELCGTKLIYYSTPDEDIDEASHDDRLVLESSRPTTPMESYSSSSSSSSSSSDSIPNSMSRHPTIIENDEDINITTDEGGYQILKSNTNDSTTTTAISSSKRLYEGLIQMASNGLDSLKQQPMSSSETPRGVIDLIKEYANVSVVSTGHLYAATGAAPPPTPYCLTVTTKLDIKWEFSFTSQSCMMEWLMALTNVIIRASVDATKNDGWLIEDYDCIQHVRRVDESNNKAIIDRETSAAATPRISVDALVVSSTSSIVEKTTVGSSQQLGTTNQLTISGIHMYVAWASANIALILARCSLTTANQYWSLVVFTNVGIWQLCLRKRYDEINDTNNTTQTMENNNTLMLLAKKGSYKPIAGTTTVKVTKVEDPEITGHKLPTWLSVSSSCFEVRSHGYLTTKKKIPCPGELYECIAVDCFVSNSRVLEIAPRVRFSKEFNTNWKDSKKTWVSPDIFVVSLSIPTEAPTFGKSSDDGPGATFIGYYKMKEETRAILRRITAVGYDPITDTSDGVDEGDVQKRITNGVRLWEKYCQVAPLDPTFQARFKLIPMGNLEELGCPSYISKYSGKPVLIKRNQVTGFFYDYPTLNCMEFDISLHPFPYLFKQGVAYLKDYFERTVWTLGFVIEGRCDDELPEVVIGTMKVCHPNPKFVVNGEDLFDGKCVATEKS